jgi:hypothetical protein
VQLSQDRPAPGHVLLDKICYFILKVVVGSFQCVGQLGNATALTLGDLLHARPQLFNLLSQNRHFFLLVVDFSDLSLNEALF